MKKSLLPGDRFVDIGANIGFFSILLGKNTEKGKIFAVEPTESALKRLYANLKLNNVSDKVIVFEGVVSDYNGTIEIKIIPGKEEYSKT